MQDISIEQITLIMLMLVVGIVILAFLKIKQLTQRVFEMDNQLQASEVVLSDLQVENQGLYTQLEKISQEFELKSLEDIQVSKQLEHRVKNLQQSLQQVNQQVVELRDQQPQDKLYSRAYKLAALGADVEEIMAECEIPRAEVEMLLAVYKNKL